MDTTLDILEELGRRFRDGDLAGAAALYHPEFRIQQPSSLPHGGWHEGQEGMAEMARQFSEHWDRTIADQRLIGGGDDALMMSTQTWTAKATGRSATCDVLELFSFKDGLISQIRVFQQDTHLMLSTLGPE